MILCIVYVSTSNSSLLRVASCQLSKLVHTFTDVTYNRTSYFFIEKVSASDHLKKTILEFCAQAYETIDFSKHDGTHPTLGACDHICLSPLGDSTIENVLGTAKELAQDFRTKFGVPVHTYGALSEFQERLSHLRKKLGYFDGSNVSLEFDKCKGITCMGVVPFVLNYNIRFSPNDTRDKVCKVTSYVRSAEVDSLLLSLPMSVYVIRSEHIYLLCFYSTGRSVDSAS